MNGFEDIQKASKDNMELAMRSLGAVSKGAQALAVETSDYTKKFVETGAAATEKMMSAKSLDTAVEVQADYSKQVYESAVGYMTKFNEMMVDITKDAYKPYEGFFAKAGK